MASNQNGQKIVKKNTKKTKNSIRRGFARWGWVVRNTQFILPNNYHFKKQVSCEENQELTLQINLILNVVFQIIFIKMDFKPPFIINEEIAMASEI